MAKTDHTPTAEELIKLFHKDTNGSYTLDANEFDTVLKALGDPSVVDKVNQELGRNIDYNQFKEAATSLLQGASNYPNYQARLERRIKRGDVTQDVASGLVVAKDIFQIGTAANQIKQSNSSLARLKRPALPALPQNDKVLSNALSDAQRGTFEAARTIEPARQGIDRGYAQDLNTAREASGGNAGEYGALAQTASLRRNRSLGELAPVIDSARARQQARVDALLQNRSQLRQQDFENRSHLYDLQNANYNQDAGAAAQLGLVGRENLYGGIGNLPNSLGVVAGGLATSDALNRNNTQPTSTYHGLPELDQMQSTINQYHGYRDPNYVNKYFNQYYNPNSRLS